MFNFIKKLFGFGAKPEVVEETAPYKIEAQPVEATVEKEVSRPPVSVTDTVPANKQQNRKPRNPKPKQPAQAKPVGEAKPNKPRGRRPSKKPSNTPKA